MQDRVDEGRVANAWRCGYIVETFSAHSLALGSTRARSGVTAGWKCGARGRNTASEFQPAEAAIVVRLRSPTPTSQAVNPLAYAS